MGPCLLLNKTKKEQVVLHYLSIVYAPHIILDFISLSQPHYLIKNNTVYSF